MKIKASDLIIDDKLIGLRPINAFFVSRYRQAYRSGAKMPPIIIDESTSRVVSGNHRLTAIIEEYGPDKEIKTQPRKFKNEREVLEFFTRENATHGNPLDSISKKRLTGALMNEGATPEEIATLFNVSVKRIEKWGQGTVFVTVGNSKSKLVPIKHGVHLPAEKPTMTQEQYKTHIQADRGVSPLSMIQQLTRWLINGWIEGSDENIEAINQLSKAIEVWSKTEDAAVG